MDEVIKTKFDNVEAEFRRVSHRLENVEGDVKSFQQIAVSVEKLALTMQGMLEEQKSQGARLDKIEHQPADRWNKLIEKVLELIIAAVIGYGLAKIF